MNQSPEFDLQSIANVYVKYYNETYNSHRNLFTGTDPSINESTNDHLETLYNELIKFKVASEYDTDIFEYSPDDQDYSYLLELNHNPYMVCNTLFPLLTYLSTIDWQNNVWKITAK